MWRKQTKEIKTNQSAAESKEIKANPGENANVIMKPARSPISYDQKGHKKRLKNNRIRSRNVLLNTRY
jgi:hypothetical protein